MTDKEQQIKNSFVYLIPVIVGNLIPLITLPIFTRVLTREDYGVLALAQVYAIFMTGLANFGLTVGYERNFFEYRSPKRAAELLYSTLLFVVTAYLVCGLATFLFKAPLARLIVGSSEHAELLFWSFCSTGLMSLKIYYLTYFKNMENARSLVWYTVDESILGVIISLFFVVYLGIGVIGLVFGQLIASLVVFSALAFRFLKLLTPSLNWHVLKDSLKLSYPLTPRIFLSVIGNQFDKYLIGLMSTVGGVGIYSIGQKVANVIFTYMTAIQNVFSPQVYRRMFDLGAEGSAAVGRYLTPFAYVSIAFGLMIALFSEEIIFILTPPPFHDAIDIVIVLSMFYGSQFFGKQPQLIYAKKTYITSLLTVVSILLTIIVAVPFTMKWGAMGTAWGILLSGLVSMAIFFMVSQHYYRIEWEYPKIIAIFLIFFVSAFSIIFLRYIMVEYTLRLLLKGLFIASYAYLGIKIRIITAENFDLLKNMIRVKGSAVIGRN